MSGQSQRRSYHRVRGSSRSSLGRAAPRGLASRSSSLFRYQNTVEPLQSRLDVSPLRSRCVRRCRWSMRSFAGPRTLPALQTYPRRPWSPSISSSRPTTTTSKTITSHNSTHFLHTLVVSYLAVTLMSEFSEHPLEKLLTADRAVSRFAYNLLARTVLALTVRRHAHNSRHTPRAGALTVRARTDVSPQPVIFRSLTTSRNRVLAGRALESLQLVGTPAL